MSVPPGKRRLAGAEHPGAAALEDLVLGRYPLAAASAPGRLLDLASSWATAEACAAWEAAYLASGDPGSGSFLDHPCWGACRDLGGGRWLWGAMDDRWATCAARLLDSGALDPRRDVAGKECLAVGAWDGTECLLLSALGAARCDALDESPDARDMASAQLGAWQVAGEATVASAYELPLLAAGRYDLVYASGVLYHASDLAALLLALRAALRPGGLLAAETTLAPGDGLEARYSGPRVRGWSWWCPTAPLLEALASDCGLEGARVVERSGGRGWLAGRAGKGTPPAVRGGRAGLPAPARFAWEG